MEKSKHDNKLNLALLELGRKNKFFAKSIATLEYLMLSKMPYVRKIIDEAVKLYSPEEIQRYSGSLRKLKKDMLYSRMVYGVNFKEYVLFEYEKRSDAGRRDFVGIHEKKRNFNALRNEDAGVFEVFLSKYKAYQAFQPYYKRELLLVKGPEDRDAFHAFLKKHLKLIIKVENGSLGEDISVIDQSKDSIDVEALFAKIISDGSEHLIEEFVIQDQKLMALHPSSVNTVRFVTYLKDDEVMHIFSFLRMGSGNGVIDNATAGGIAAAIDLKSGIVSTPGFREDRSQYIKHPDTGVQIIGMQIPRWEELLAMVDTLARVIPEQKYVGWDLALTKDGWIMIEGNDSAMMTAIQMCNRQGLRPITDIMFSSNG